jgi:beta-phosphoglucomutase family hydrolase
MKTMFKAIVFDLDGVITDTAVTHFGAWKQIFDEFLKEKAAKAQIPYKEFTETDYLNYVDGKPRLDGVSSFLESRGINLPLGLKDDTPDKDTISGLGNHKNEVFLEILGKEGTKVYPSSKILLRDLKNTSVKIGVASSSKNCHTILDKTGLLQFFDVMVDGIVSEKTGLNGKPEPDIFISACELMNSKPEESIVVEDAVSGVQAGVKGNFGFILGIARKDNKEELQKNGADYVVTDLEEVNGIEGLNKLFMLFKKK